MSTNAILCLCLVNLICISVVLNSCIGLGYCPTPAIVAMVFNGIGLLLCVVRFIYSKR